MEEGVFTEAIKQNDFAGTVIVIEIKNSEFIIKNVTLNVSPSQQKSVFDLPDFILSLPDHLAILPRSLDGGWSKHVGTDEHL